VFVQEVKRSIYSWSKYHRLRQVVKRTLAYNKQAWRLTHGLRQRTTDKLRALPSRPGGRRWSRSAYIHGNSAHCWHSAVDVTFQRLGTRGILHSSKTPNRRTACGGSD